MFLRRVKTHLQFQMIRSGVDFGYGAPEGSSLLDKCLDPYAAKYFLMDGVYRWDSIIKLGASWNIKANAFPVSVFAEAGFVNTRFTINAAAWSSGKSGTGYEAEYETINDSVYQGRKNLIISVGFRLFCVY